MTVNLMTHDIVTGWGLIHKHKVSLWALHFLSSFTTNFTTTVSKQALRSILTF
jgi:hypothetical protein